MSLTADSWLLRRRWPLGLVLVAVFCLIALVTQNAYYARLGIWYGAIYAIVVAGLNVLIGASGQVSLGTVGLVVIGAYVSGWAGTAGMPWVIAALLAMIFAMLGGLVIGAPALRLRGAYLALSTLAFALVVFKLLEAVPRVLQVPGSEAVVLNVPRPVIGTLTFAADNQYFLFCVIVAAPMVALARNYFWTQTGRELQAVRDDESAAAALGISVYPAKLGAFIFSAALAGLAGAMLASLNGFVTPQDFFVGKSVQGESLRYVVALLIGGLAAPVAGPIVGAIGMLILVWLGQTYFQDNQALLTGVVFLLLLAIAPRGLGGLFRRGSELIRIDRWLPGPGITLAIGAAGRRGTPNVTSELASGPESARPQNGRNTHATLPAVPTKTDTGDTGGSAPAPLLEVSGLTKSFGGVHAVEDVSFDVPAGQIHVLMGPNGSGKSTCLDLITGLSSPDAGRVRIGGRDVTELAAHRRARFGVGRTFQEIKLFGSLNALENCMVGTGSKYRAVTQITRLPFVRREDEASADRSLETLDAWGLAEFAERKASDLSYGQSKMLELARAVSRQPRLLLVDEPSAGLNPTWVDAMVRALSGLREIGYTLLIVEHHQDVIADLADVVTVLDHGRVIAQGPPAAVQRDPAVINVYLGTAGTGAGS